MYLRTIAADGYALCVDVKMQLASLGNDYVTNGNKTALVKQEKQGTGNSSLISTREKDGAPSLRCTCSTGWSTAPQSQHPAPDQ